MIKSLDIKNFRCFDNVTLKDFGRINVVTGANASGKTALFEALYLGVNATATALQNISMLRNPSNNSPSVAGPFVPGLPITIPIGFPQQSTNSFEGLFRWSSVLHGAGQREPIVISFTDTNETRFSLSLSYDQTGTEMPIPVVRGPGGANTSPPLIFERSETSTTGTEKKASIPVTVNQFGQLQQQNVEAFGPSTYIFGAVQDYAEFDNVVWFSQLKEKGDAEPIIEFIKQQFPIIANIEILAPAGSNGLYATLTDGSRRRITAVSAGIYKIISILLGCSHTRNGIIIIDELENGIYYEKYLAVWEILYKFAKLTGNQIFVSSHSLECLAALTPILDDNEKDFTLIRTERHDNKFSVTHISGKSMKSALNLGGEIRG